MKRLLAFAVLLLPVAAYAAARSYGFGSGEIPAGEGGDTGEGVDLLPSTLDEPSFLEAIGLAPTNMTRGERNNNPGNIRISSSAWLGKIAGTDPAFETFADPADGIRALAKLLKGYQAKYGLDSIRAIISRWAPSNENNTDAYVRSVSMQTGFGVDQSLDLSDKNTLAALTTAIITHENGRNSYDAATIQKGVNAA